MNDPKNDETSHEPLDLRHATDVWLSVVQSYNHCAATLTARAARRGFTLLQHEVLINLLRLPGSTQQDLADRCFSAKSGMSVLISDFQKRGFLTRRKDPQDRRIWRLSLTDAGQAAARAARQDQQEVIEAMTAVFSAQELSDLKSWMDQASEILIDLQKADAP